MRGDGLLYLPGLILNVQNSQLQGQHYLGAVADSALLNMATVTLQSDYSTLATGNPFQPDGALVQ